MVVLHDRVGADPEALVRDVELVADAAAALIEVQPERDVYSRLAGWLQQVVGDDAVISVGSYEPDGRTFAPRVLVGLGPDADKVATLLGKRPLELTGDCPAAVQQLMAAGRLARVEGGVVALAGDVIAPVLCRQIATLLGLEDVYVIGFTRGRCTGGVSIITRRPRMVLRQAAIEALVRMAGAAIVRNRTERRQVEAAEDRFRVSFEKGAVGQVLTSLDGRFLRVNQAFARMLGYSAAELEGKTFNEVTHPDDRRVGTHAMRALAAGEEVVRFEKRYVARSGAILWVDGNVAVVRDATGQPQYFVGTFVDVTDRRRAEETAQAAEIEYRAIVENEPACVKVLDREGGLLEMNPAGLAMLEATAEQVLGKKAVDLVAPEDRAAFDEMVAAVFRGEPSHLVFDMIGLKGRRLTLETFSVPLLKPGPAGGVRALLGVTRDITEGKRTEEALRASERRMREIVEHAPFGAHLYDLTADGRLVFAGANPAADAILHVRNSQFIGMTIEDAFPSLAGTGVPAAYRRVAATGERYDTEQVDYADGHIRGAFEVHAFQTGANRMAAFFRDITERKLLEEQLRQAQKMEAIGLLAGGVAHDFNNILAAMMMGLDLMAANPSLDRTAQESVAELNKGARRAANLTRQLLMFSRRSVLAVRSLDLNEVVGNLLKMLGRLLGEDITLAFERRGSLSAVEADPGMLEQVVLNLAVNARDAMPKGGRITLATEDVQIDREQVAANAARRTGRFVCLSVVDTGSGMDAPTLDRVFEPFFTTKPEGKGTGLGLATVYGIVAQHKGWVEVDSTVGQGTSFRIYLPAATGKVVEPEAKGPQPVPRGRETLLIVEDEAGVRRTLVQTLRGMGYQVLVAANGQEAMTVWMAHRRDVDLLLTDVVMPEGLTGLELAERLRADKPDLKVIISTGYSAEASQQGLRAAAGIAYLPKPYDALLLGRTIRDCLDL